VIDVRASNTDGFLLSDTCGFSTQLNRDIWNEERLSPAGNLSCRKYCCQNITEFSQGNNVLDAVASNTDCLFAETYVFLQLS
jgi:hypothetical protein